MTPTILFYALFAATLVLLVAVLLTGLRARRRLHIGLVIATVAMLLVTVLQAYRLGKIYDLPTAGTWTPVHMFLARAAAFSFIPTSILGLLTLRDGKRRRAHGVCAWIAFALTASAAITGTVMLSKARLRADAASASGARAEVVASDPR